MVAGGAMMYQPIKASRAVRQDLCSLFAAGGPNIRQNNPSRERCTYSKLNPHKATRPPLRARRNVTTQLVQLGLCFMETLLHDVADTDDPLERSIANHGQVTNALQRHHLH